MKEQLLSSLHISSNIRIARTLPPTHHDNLDKTSSTFLLRVNQCAMIIQVTITETFQIANVVSRGAVLDLIPNIKLSILPAFEKLEALKNPVSTSGYPATVTIWCC